MSLTNQHGGDLDYIHRVYNIPRDEIIDFSGNVNPIGISPSVKKAITENIDLLSTYPDVNYTSLRSAISSYTGAKAENIIVGNGSTELISLFIKSVCPKKSVIISPAYSEYEREIKLCGGKPLLFPLREEEDFRLNIPDLFNAMDKDTNLLVICNPNNPTGSFLVKSELLRIAEFCRGNNIRILIDETYAEFSDDDMEVSAIPLADDFKNIFIIRGTSKFFASPGLRLGYAITSDTDITDTINKKKDPWSVNILASVGGEEMFKDTAYINETKQLISSERKKIISELSTWKNIKLYDTQSNFILLKILNKNITAAEIFDKLIKHKIVIRDASDFPYLDYEFLRFCILSKEHNQLLLTKLKEIIE